MPPNISKVPHSDPAIDILERVIARLEDRVTELEEWQRLLTHPVYWRILLWFARRGYKKR